MLVKEATEHNIEYSNALNEAEGESNTELKWHNFTECLWREFWRKTDDIIQGISLYLWA